MPPNSHAVRGRADEERWRESRRDHRVGTPSGAAEQTRPGDHHPARHAVQPSPPVPLAELHAPSDRLRRDPMLT